MKIVHRGNGAIVVTVCSSLPCIRRTDIADEPASLSSILQPLPRMLAARNDYVLRTQEANSLYFTINRLQAVPTSTMSKARRRVQIV